MSQPIHPDVIAMARDGEPDRYIAATLSPEAARPGMIALAAFAADLRRIPSVVKEPMMGEVRLQWWRDVIAAFDAGTPSGHPIADALGDATRVHALPPLSLIAMTEARAFDLYDDPMSDEGAFAGYLAKTEAIPFSLARRILSGDEMRPDLATRAGEMFGRARILADLPRLLARGRLPLPIALLDEAGVDVDGFMRGETSHATKALRDRLCNEIATSYASMRSTFGALAAQDRMALLPLATIPVTLNAIRKRADDAARRPIEVSPLARVWRIGRARWLGL